MSDSPKPAKPKELKEVKEEESAVSIKLPGNVFRGLKHIAIDRNTSLSALVREAAIEYYEKSKKPE